MSTPSSQPAHTHEPGLQKHVREKPRLYQVEMFEKAKLANVVAVLDTGSGKTLISLLLLQHIAKLSSSILNSEDHQVSVFLVPTIPLVSQQARYISTNSELKVAKMYGGSSNSNAMDEEGWLTSSRVNDVIVLTSMILLNGLDRGFVKMSQVILITDSIQINLIVFDECHHARSSHPYNLIMQIHYSICDEGSRPKIFGMTASPCSAKESSSAAVEQLEKNLHCTAISASSTTSLQNYVNRPTEKIVYYEDSSTFFPPPFLYLTIANYFPSLLPFLEREIADSISICGNEMLNVDTLGPWTADRALELAVTELSFFAAKRIKQLGRKEGMVATAQRWLSYLDVDNPGAVLGQVCCMLTKEYIDGYTEWEASQEERAKKLEERNGGGACNPATEDYDYTGMVFVAKKNVDPLLAMTVVDLNNLLECCDSLASMSNWGEAALPPLDAEMGAKIHALVELLLEYEDDEKFFCGIIFCQQRIMARVLEVTLRKHPRLGFIKSACLLGHGARSNSYKTSGMSVTGQEMIVNKFRSGGLNLLIATQVAEEGLDIRPCNCVIRFDMSDMNLISYVQSRGRARHKTSQFVLLAPKGDPGPRELLIHLKYSEELLQKTLSNADDFQRDEFNTDVKDSDIYRITSTGASVTVFNAIQFLYEYCSTLPRDHLYEPIPEFLIANGVHGVAAELHMPLNVHLACQKLRGPICDSELSAKRQVAFRMIKLLHSYGMLDDHVQGASCAILLDTSLIVPLANVAINNSPTAANVPHAVDSVKRVADMQLGPVITPKKFQKAKKKVRNHDIHIPTAFQGEWVDGVSVYLNAVCITSNDQIDTLTVGFLSFGLVDPRVGNFSFSIDAGLLEISMVSLLKPIRLTSLAIGQMKKFHYEYFMCVLRSKLAEDLDWKTLCVPLRHDSDLIVKVSRDIDPNTIIDWDALSFCYDHDPLDKSFLADPLALKDFVLFDEFRYKRNYLLIEVLPDMTPFSELSNSSFDTVAKMYLYRFKCELEINPDQSLVNAMPLGYPYNSSKGSNSFEEVLLIPQLCTVSPIKRGHITSALLFPILIRQITHRLLMQDIHTGQAFFKFSKLSLNLPIDLLSESFTATSANVPLNYERLETLGDAFLKIHLGLHTFVRYPHYHEGQLTSARCSLETNVHLRNTAHAMKLEGYILFEPFSRGNYIPPTTGLSQTINDKSVADVVEAVIGASYLEGGEVNAANSVSFFLGVEVLSWDAYRDMWQSYKILSAVVETNLIQSCIKVSLQIGYVFKDVSLLAQALTHSSSVGPSYERLEYLGDAILGFIATAKIYALEPKLEPGPFTSLRSELVCNQFLGVLSCALGLPHYINHSNVGVGTSMTEWDEEVQAGYTSEYEPSNALYWNRLKTSPKVLGDVYEAILGAVFVDSNFSMEAVAAVLDLTLFTPWWSRFEGLVNEGDFEGKHPVKELQELLNIHKCYGLITNADRPSPGHNVVTFLIHEVEIGKGQAVIAKDARKEAAFKAVEFMKANWADSIAGCNCIGWTSKEGVESEIVE